jgi:hypothetical protein
MNFAFEKVFKLTGPVLPKQKNSMCNAGMKFATMQHMPLMSAYLCPDCNCVGNSASHCPACNSGVLLSLSVILNREEKVGPQKRGESRRLLLVPGLPTSSEKRNLPELMDAAG